MDCCTPPSRPAWAARSNGARRKRFGAKPFTLSIAGETMYYIPHGEPIQAYFKNSRDLDSKALSLLGLNQFGCPPDDMKRIGADNSGIHARPAAGYEHLDNKQRYFYTTHRDFHSLLMGKSLDAMTARFVRVLTGRMRAAQQVQGTEWTELPDFYVFLRNEMFQANMQALCGDRFFELNPDFTQVFWDLDGKMLDFLRRLPRWMAAKSHALRDQALAAVAKWHRVSNERFDWHDEDLVEAEWEPQFGAHLMRARQQMFGSIGTSAASHAAMDLGMMWA